MAVSAAGRLGRQVSVSAAAVRPHRTVLCGAGQIYSRVSARPTAARWAGFVMIAGSAAGRRTRCKTDSVPAGRQWAIPDRPLPVVIDTIKRPGNRSGARQTPSLNT